MKLVPEKLK